MIKMRPWVSMFYRLLDEAADDIHDLSDDDVVCLVSHLAVVLCHAKGIDRRHAADLITEGTAKITAAL